MQYKIPVQIENEDPIFLWLSLRQLIILMVGFGISYSIFESLAQNVGTEIALVPSLIVGSIFALIALFKAHEMTFVPFLLAVLRLNINATQRTWTQGVDSFSALDVWYVTATESKQTKKVESSSKQEKLESIEDQLKHL